MSATVGSACRPQKPTCESTKHQCLAVHQHNNVSTDERIVEVTEKAGEKGLKSLGENLPVSMMMTSALDHTAANDAGRQRFAVQDYSGACEHFTVALRSIGPDHPDVRARYLCNRAAAHLQLRNYGQGKSVIVPFEEVLD